MCTAIYIHMHGLMLQQGQRVVVTTKSGDQISGIYSGGTVVPGNDRNCILKYDIGVKSADPSKPPPDVSGGKQDSIIIPGEELMDIVAENIILGGSESSSVQNGERYLCCPIYKKLIHHRYRLVQDRR